jgi:CRP/FNR family transcriptional regulator, cyclic AMP receptor protein
VLLVVYSAINISLASPALDPYPFILLNLVLSMLAAIQAPVIMMSQNRQDTKDRLAASWTVMSIAARRQNIQGLASKLNALADKVGDIDERTRTLVATPSRDRRWRRRSCL